MPPKMYRYGEESVERTVYGEHARRLDALEKKGSSDWIYVGDYPSAADTMPDSPEFQNGFSAGYSATSPLRFRLLLDGTVEIDGVLDTTAATDGATIFTLPEDYRPDKQQRVARIGSGGVPYSIQIQTDGDVVYNDAALGASTVSMNWAINTGSSRRVQGTGTAGTGAVGTDYWVYTFWDASPFTFMVTIQYKCDFSAMTVAPTGTLYVDATIGGPGSPPDNTDSTQHEAIGTWTASDDGSDAPLLSGVLVHNATSKVRFAYNGGFLTDTDCTFTTSGYLTFNCSYVKYVA